MTRVAFSSFMGKWNDAYHGAVDIWEDDLPDLLTFMDYPCSIRQSIYITNWLKRKIKEFRRREKTRDILHNPKSAKKLFYLLSKKQSESWAKRIMRGFKKARDQLDEMFKQRYGRNRIKLDQATRRRSLMLGIHNFFALLLNLRQRADSVGETLFTLISFFLTIK